MKQLDFTNPQLQQWLESCPFKIRNLQQLCFEPKHQKEVELVVEIPIEKCAANLAYYGLKLDEKTAELESEYMQLDKEWKRLIAAEINEKNPIKILKIEERSTKIHRRLREVGDQLKEICTEVSTDV